MVGPPRSTAGAGEVGALRLLLTAQALSQLGFRLLGLAMPILATTTLHASAFEVSAVAACQTAAFLVVGLPAGVWVDRMRKRTVMVACDLGRAVALGSIPVAWTLGTLDVLHLCAVSSSPASSPSSSTSPSRATCRTWSVATDSSPPTPGSPVWRRWRVWSGPAPAACSSRW